MVRPKACAALREASRAVAGAVVGHHTRDVDAKLADVGDGGPEEVGDTGAGPVGRDLGETDAGAVVDADMHVVPAGPRRALAAVLGDAVAKLLRTVGGQMPAAMATRFTGRWSVEHGSD